MHLADAFIQSDLQCIQVIHFHQYVCSLGIEPTTFCAADAMLYHWATQEHLLKLCDIQGFKREMEKKLKFLLKQRAVLSLQKKVWRLADHIFKNEMHVWESAKRLSTNLVHSLALLYDCKLYRYEHKCVTNAENYLEFQMGL